MQSHNDEFDDDSLPDDNELASIERLVKKAIEYEAEIETLEAHLEQLKKEQRQIIERDLVERMLACGAGAFTSASGMSVSIESSIYAKESVKDEAKRSELMHMRANWLAANGGEALVQESIELRFDRGEHEEAKYIKEVLNDINARYAVSENINTASLKSFVNTKLADGEDVPLDKLGFYKRVWAKITQPKAKSK